MDFQGLRGGHLRLLTMLLEPPGKSDMFSGRVFPRYRTAFKILPSGKWSLIESNRHFLGMRSNAAFKPTKQKDIFTFQNLVNSLHSIYSIFVPQFLLNSFCSFDTSFAYHALIRSKMILIISLHTVDPMLSPLWLSDFDPFPFQRVSSLELPQTTGISKFE